MSQPFSILIAEQTRLVLLSSTGQRIELPAGPDSQASAVMAALKSAGSTNNTLILGIPAAWCLSASISTADLPRNDRRANLYRLEESLPVAAENLVADFVLSGTSALGVCVRLDRVQPLLDSLLAQGIHVGSILPTALATTQEFSRSSNIAECLLLSLESEDQLNVILLKQGQLAQWDLIPATPADLKLQLELLSAQLGSIPPIYAINFDSQRVATFAEHCGQIFNNTDQDASILAARFAHQLLSGRCKPWVDFRRDQLAMMDSLSRHRKWIDLCLAAAIAFFISLSITFLFRANGYEQIDQANIQAVVTLFHNHFPGWETPINVRAVVDAQYRRAQGLADPSASNASSRSALVTLHDVLLPMLEHDHFQIEKMAFHENGFELTGRLQSIDQIDSLAKAARSHNMNVLPAQTHKEADGSWAFTLQGTRSKPISVSQQ